MRFTLITLIATVICVAAPVHAEVASVYVQGNGGVTSGRVNGLPEGSAAPDHGASLGAQVGARLLFGEAYIDHAAFSRTGSITRYVLGARGGIGFGKIELFGRAGLGYLNERDGALAGELDPMRDRHGFIARAGGGLDYSLGYGFYLGGALETEYFRVTPKGSSMLGDEVRSGTDMFGYLYLKLQLGL